MASMPLRTRLFGALLKLVVRPPTTGAEMIGVRVKRDRLMSTGLGRLLLGADVADVDVHEARAGSIRFLIHTPRGDAGPRPVVVNYHGGGWCLGSPEQSRWLASRVAAQVGAVVVSPTYRLAPEHPYPAAVEDAWTALQWVRAHASGLGGDPVRLAVMGDSAGGGLAAATALRARDEGEPVLRGQVLIYPGVEMYDRWPSEDANADAPVLTSVGMRTFVRIYLADAYGTEDWRASPIRAASHVGLPPALILTAGHDPLRDHGSRYTEVLARAGVPVELIDHPEAIHGFMSLPGVVPAARVGLDQIVAFLRKVL